MAADIAAIVRNLTAFYAFAGKSMLHVGAGGGQFVAFAARARRVVGVDPDRGALELLRAAVRAAGLQDRYHPRCAEVLTVLEPTDVVLFEFRLHEMEDRKAALAHARTLAPETLIVDHSPDSPWARYCGEEAQVASNWEVTEAARPIRVARYHGTQTFHDFAELEAELGTLGEPTPTRITPFRGLTDFSIEMPYRFALLRQVPRDVRQT
jgi:2-polyprenyl-3-methyl-5-hydroxy-6-metoxy-1,4-benzoquinol methylase